MLLGAGIHLGPRAVTVSVGPWPLFSCRFHRLHRGADLHRVDGDDREDRDAGHGGGVALWICQLQAVQVTHPMHSRTQTQMINLFFFWPSVMILLTYFVQV